MRWTKGLTFPLIAAAFAVTGPTSRAQTGPLLFQSSLTYLGGFRVPELCGGTPDDRFGYGGDAIAFNPTGNGGAGSMFVSGHLYYKHVAEISIPALVNSSTLTALNTAGCLQSFSDPSEGARSQAVGYDIQLTGMVVVNGKLWVNNADFYDNSPFQNIYLLSRPLDLSTTGQVKGLYGLTSSQTGFVPSMAAKSVAAISSEWSSVMGGDLFLSKFNLPIVSSQSWGPNAIVANSSVFVGPAQATYPAVVHPPLFYTLSHNPSGSETMTPGQTYTYFSLAHSDGSVVQPTGTSTLLAFQVAGATRGLADGGYGYGYGCGCSDPATRTTGGGPLCWGVEDPVNCPVSGGGYWYDPEHVYDKGPHGYPYVYQVAAYNMNDLATAKNGTINPWDVIPYSIWEFSFPIAATKGLGSVTYDAATNRIYIAQRKGDTMGEPRPIIHVFQVNP
jgi:hypothetical protein